MIVYLKTCYLDLSCAEGDIGLITGRKAGSANAVAYDDNLQVYSEE
ncbi:MAG: hypothetical protein ABIJ56_00345 [Pseudomonadota bacterium]